jgi:hypothetical protein
MPHEREPEAITSASSWPYALAAPPLEIASAFASCVPVLSPDARMNAFERCDRVGGFVSFGYDYVECWSNSRREFMYWRYTIADAAGSEP